MKIWKEWKREMEDNLPHPSVSRDEDEGEERDTKMNEWNNYYNS